MGFAYTSGSICAVVMGVIFMFDAIVGLSILHQIFSNVDFEDEINDQPYANMLDDTENKEKKYNDRIPEQIRENELGEKMFSKGWKFNMFNGTQ